MTCRISYFSFGLWPRWPWAESEWITEATLFVFKLNEIWKCSGVRGHFDSFAPVFWLAPPRQVWIGYWFILTAHVRRMNDLLNNHSLGLVTLLANQITEGGTCRKTHKKKKLTMVRFSQWLRMISRGRWKSSCTVVKGEIFQRWGYGLLFVGLLHNNIFIIALTDLRLSCKRKDGNTSCFRYC